MKITIFIIVLVLKSNENVEMWHFRLSQLADSSNHCKKQFISRRVQSVRPKLTHKLEVFLQSSVWSCWWSSVADHPILFARLSSARRWFWLGLTCLVAFKHSSPDMIIKRIKVWWPFVFSDEVTAVGGNPVSPVKIVIFIVIVLHGSVVV